MSMSEPTQNIREKEKLQIDKILSFATGKYVDIPTISHNNTKTQKQIVQAGMVKEATKTGNKVHTKHRLTSKNEKIQNLERILTEFV